MPNGFAATFFDTTAHHLNVPFHLGVLVVPDDSSYDAISGEDARRVYYDLPTHQAGRHSSRLRLAYLKTLDIRAYLGSRVRCHVPPSIVY